MAVRGRDKIGRTFSSPAASIYRNEGSDGPVPQVQVEDDVLVREGRCEQERAALTSEADLVRAAQCGDRSAFDALAAQHAPTILRAAYVILGSGDEAEDVAQDTLIAAYRNLATYRHDAPFGAWLHRIAVNRSYDHIRRRQRQHRLVDDLIGGSSGSDEDNAVLEARAGEVREEVRELIAGLDAKNRAIVALRFLEDMPLKEIAATLDMPEGTVKRRLHEVLKVLRVRMTEGATR